MSNPRICPSCKKYNYEVGDNCCEWCGNKLPPAGVVKEKAWIAKRAQNRSPAATIAAIYLITVIALIAAAFLLVSVFTGWKILPDRSTGDAAVQTTEISAEDEGAQTTEIPAGDTEAQIAETSAVDAGA